MVSKRKCVVATTMLVCLAVGCAGVLSPADVRRLDRDGDIDGLLRAWRSGPPVSVQPALVEAIAHQPDDARGRRVVIKAATGHPNEAVRSRAVAALSAYEGEEAQAVLISALGDPFPSVRAQARASLAGRAPDVFGLLSTASRADRSPLVRASAVELVTQGAQRTAGLRGSAVAALRDRAKRDDQGTVRAAAAKGLGMLNAVSARPLLTEMARTDDSATVRAAAAEALRKLDPPVDSERAIVAVMPLRNDTDEPELDRLGVQIADFLGAELATAGVCEVVDPAKRDAAIAELRKIGSPLYDGDRLNAPQLGNFALADQFAFGVVQKTGLIYTIVLNRMDVSSLKLIPGASVSVRGYREDLDRLKVEAARTFVARFR